MVASYASFGKASIRQPKKDDLYIWICTTWFCWGFSAYLSDTEFPNTFRAGIWTLPNVQVHDVLLVEPRLLSRIRTCPACLMFFCLWLGHDGQANVMRVWVCIKR